MLYTVVGNVSVMISSLCLKWRVRSWFIMLTCTSLFGASAKKKAGFNSLIGALSYSTKQRNTSPAGTGSNLDPGCFTVTLQWTTGSSFRNKTTAVPSVLNHTGHAHALPRMHFTAYCTQNQKRSCGQSIQRLRQCSPQTWWKYERLWQLLRLHLKCFKILPLLQLGG